MKLLAKDFNYSEARWDAYKAFHQYIHSGFVFFDTGELIVTRNYFRPDSRKFYADLNLTLFNVHDRHRTFLNKFTDPDGQPIKQSWISNQQTLLLDHCTKRVIALGNFSTKTTSVPSRFASYGVSAYFAGSEREPVGGKAVGLNRPKKPTPEQAEFLKEIVAQCKAAHRVGAYDDWIRSNYHPHAPVPTDYVLSYMNVDRSAWKTAMLVQIAKFGLKPMREEFYQPYLLLND